jgi:tetratricopeptide (TPR) repeat protein
MVTESQPPNVDNEFSGRGDAVIQTGSIHGDVYMHGRRLRRSNFPPPHQLPARPAGFVDRKEHLQRLDQMLSNIREDSDVDNPSVTVIAGPPGVGKTALALYWAHAVRHDFPDGDLYIDMRGYGPHPPLSADQALDSFLRAMNFPPEGIPVETSERAALYRSLLGIKKMLIVIDNASSVKQIRDLLPGSRQCVVLVTSRGQLSSLVAREGADRVTIDVLSPGDAVALLSEIVGDDRIERNNEAAVKIAQLCGYLPLTLRVVAERIAGQPYLSLSDAVGQLEGEKNRLDALAASEDELADVRVVFSWSYRMLTSSQSKTFRLIGLHAGPEFSVRLGAALTNETVDTTANRLLELAEVHLIQQVDFERYRLHDLLRAYSLEVCQHAEHQRERTHAVRRMLVWYLLAADVGRKAILPYSHAVELSYPGEFDLPIFDDAATAMTWFEGERINLLAALQVALDWGQYDLAWKLPVVLDGFFELRSYWFEWKDIHDDGLLAARTMGDLLGQSSNLLCRADANWRLKSHNRALEDYREAESLARRIGDTWLQGFALRGAGLIYEELGRIDDAKQRYEESLEVFRVSGIRRGEGMALMSLGKAHGATGEYDVGVAHCLSAIEIFREVGDRWSEAWGLLPLAELHKDSGDAAATEADLRSALEIFDEFGDRRSSALVLESLGRALVMRGDNIAALESWRRAVALLNDLNDPHAEDLRSTLNRLEGTLGEPT